MYGAMNGKNNFTANEYEVMRGLWKRLAVPSKMYGFNGGFGKLGHRMV